MLQKAILTGERVISRIVFVNPPLVLDEILEPLTELLFIVHFFVLHREEMANIKWLIWGRGAHIVIKV